MAEYAGLEIRIGGDTTKLNNALRSSTKAASVLQKEIRQITRAMQFNPSDMGNLDTRLKLTAERMEALQSQTKTMKTALKQLGDTNVDIFKADDAGNIVKATKSIRQLADETDNVELAAANARKRYADLTGTLEKAYSVWNKAMSNEGAEKLSWYIPVDQAKDIMKLPLAEMKQELNEVNQSLDNKIPKSVIKTVTELKKMDFHDAFRTDSVDAMLDKLSEMGVDLGDETTRIRELSHQYGEARANMEAFGKASQFQGLSVDIQRTQSEIESLSRTMKELNTVSTAEKSDDFQALSVKVKDVDEQIKKLDADIEECDRSLKINPDNLEAARQKMVDLSEKSALAADKEEMLNQQLKMLDSDEVRKAASEHENLSEWVVNARNSAQGATKEYRDQRATLNNLRTEYQQVTDTIKQLKAAEAAGSGRTEAVKKVSDAIKQVESNISSLEAEYRKLNAAWDNPLNTAGDFDRILADIQKNEEETDEYRRKLEELKRTFAELFDIPDDFWLSPEKYSEKLTDAIKRQDELKQSIAETESAAKQAGEAMESANRNADLANTANAYKNTATAARQAGDQVEDARQKTDNFVKSTNAIDPSTLKSIGMTLYSTVTPAVSMLGYKVMDASATVDAAYRDMRKTVNGTESQFESLRQAAIDFSTTHVTTADQILEIQAIGGELGVATESLDSFAEAVSNIDVATDLDTDEAATAIGHLQNIMHMTESDYSSFADALVRLGNNGASTESEIVNIAERIGSMASIVGMSTPQVLAWSSAIASTGQKSEAAGTAISKTMSFMETAVAAAGGTVDMSFENISSAVQEGGDKLTMFSNLMGMTADEFVDAWSKDPQSVFGELENNITDAKDSLQQIADVAGMSAEKFASTWESDPTAALEAFIKGLNGIEQAGGSADAVLQGMKITSVRQKQAIEGLMQTVDGLDDNLQMSQNAWDGVSDQWGAAGDAANEASKKAEGFSGQMQIMRNMAQNAAAELGEGAVPILKTMTGVLQDATEAFSGLSQGAKTGIVAGMGGAALLGPMLTVVSTAQTAGDELSKYVAIATNGSAAVAKAYKEGGIEMVKSLTAGMTMTQKAGVVAGQFASQLWRFGKVAIVVAGVAMIAKELYDLYQKAKLAKDATEGLDDAVSGIGESADVSVASVNEMSDSIGSIAASLDNTRQSIENVQQGNVDLANSINSANEEYGKTAGTLDAYMGVIDDLAGKSSLSADEQMRLKTALEEVNKQCGTNYGLDANNEIIDNNTGKVQENTDALWDNVEARKTAALIEYYKPQYTEAIGKQADAQKALNDAQDQYQYLLTNRAKIERDYVDKYGGTLADAEAAYNIEVEKAKANVKDAEAALDSADGAVDELESTLTDATQAQNDLNRAAQDTTGTLNRMVDVIGDSTKFNAAADALDMLGVSYDSLADASDGALSKLGDSTSGSMKDLIDSIQAAGGDISTLQQAMDDAGVSSESMSKVSADAFRRLYANCGNDINKTVATLGNLGIAADDVRADMVEAMLNMDSSVQSALEEAGLYSADFIRAMQDAGISAQNLNNISSEEFAAMLSSCGGDINKLIGMIQNYNRTPVANKKANIDVKGAKDLQSALDKLNRWADYPKYVKITREIAYKVTGSQQAAANLSRLDAKDRSATGSVSHRPYIPKHASGYIADGPTLTNNGWVGEAGAEAVVNWATGGTVIPLTNTRYMLPIASAIAAEMPVAANLPNAVALGINQSNIQAMVADEVGRAVTRVVAAIPNNVSVDKRELARLTRSAIA